MFKAEQGFFPELAAIFGFVSRPLGCVASNDAVPLQFRVFIFCVCISECRSFRFGHLSDAAQRICWILQTARRNFLSHFVVYLFAQGLLEPFTMQRVSIALGKLRRSRSKQSSGGDATAAAKTGADGLEAWKEVVAAGWLIKTGGKGHTVRNSKKRWFVLRGVFLSYYTEDPARSVYKDREILSTQSSFAHFYLCENSFGHRCAEGQLYLVGTSVTDLKTPEKESESQSFIIKSRSGKEFLITATKNATEADVSVESWHEHLKKAIERATTKFAEDTFEGAWLYKKKYNTSWKKRWLLMRGSASARPALYDAPSYLNFRLRYVELLC